MAQKMKPALSSAGGSALVAGQKYGYEDDAFCYPK